MARPRKEGLDYFPHDTDASSDEKIEALRVRFGNDGYAFYFIMLERIYRAPTFSVDVSDVETRQILASKVGVDLKRFNEMIKYSTDKKRNIFDSKRYRDKSVLTSNGVRKRAKAVTDKRKKARSLYIKHKEVSGAETPPETQPKPVKNPTEKGESKVKESKGKKREEQLPSTPLSPALKAWEKYTGEIVSTMDASKLRSLAEWIDERTGKAGGDGWASGPEMIASAILEDLIPRKGPRPDKPIDYLKGIVVNSLEEDIASAQ